MKTRTHTDTEGVIFVQVPHQTRATAYAFGSEAEFREWAEEITAFELEEPEPELSDRIEWIGRDLNHYDQLNCEEALALLEKGEHRGHQAIEKLTEVRKAAIQLGWIEPEQEETR
jgi:hypothetical protein